MRKVDPKRLEQIRMLSEQGLSGTAIARQMGLNLLTVSKWKKRMGLSTWPALPEEKVLELLKSGMGPRRVADTLQVSKRRVTAFAHARGFGRPPRKKLSDAELSLLKADILAREGSAAALAKKYRCSYKLVLSLAHSVLACERFLPSWENPLASYFPSRPTEAKLKKAAEEPDIVGMCVRIIESALKLLDGKMPVDKKIIVAAIASRFAPENPPADFRFGMKVWEQARANFIMGLTIACDCVARDRAALWAN